MSSVYADAKYGVVERVWFGRPRKYGGETASGFTIASGTTKTYVTRWYPKGPIKVIKVGVQVIATLASAANATGSVLRQRLPFKFYKSDGATARGTLLGSTNLVVGAGGRTARFGIASDDGMASYEVEAGKFITVYTATPNSDNGSVAAGIGTILGGGTFAPFIEWKRQFDTKWT